MVSWSGCREKAAACITRPAEHVYQRMPPVDPKVRAIIRKGYEEFLAGKTRPIEELFAERAAKSAKPARRDVKLSLTRWVPSLHPAAW